MDAPLPDLTPVPAFVVVRHGNTFGAGEPPRRIGARTDLPLTPAGETQAHALGMHFAGQGWHFTRVLTSPLIRTRDTANIIVSHLPCTPDPAPEEWLREIDHGPDENQSEDAVLARIGPAALRAWDEEAIPPPGWTVDAETRLRAWRDLLAQDAGPTLLVTSNGAARFALMAAGLTSRGGLKLPTGAYGALRKAPDATLALAEWGRRP